ncbi:hypothetical protein [Candidatus Protochlamydia phocaeensis]|uniref:hypothetical protein n=1 Tax=Candidatus Protochlamydia phocaeensis TaxID=1414722 RepID=UPI00083820C5|nr:hypothetical protein [Candidatus Protochlamydia phocaeensis]
MSIPLINGPSRPYRLEQTHLQPASKWAYKLVKWEKQVSSLHSWNPIHLIKQLFASLIVLPFKVNFNSSLPSGYDCYVALYKEKLERKAIKATLEERIQARKIMTEALGGQGACQAIPVINKDTMEHFSPSEQEPFSFILHTHLFHDSHLIQGEDRWGRIALGMTLVDKTEQERNKNERHIIRWTIGQHYSESAIDREKAISGEKTDQWNSTIYAEKGEDRTGYLKENDESHVAYNFRVQRDFQFSNKEEMAKTLKEIVQGIHPRYKLGLSAY